MFFALFSLAPPWRWRSTVSVVFFAVGACWVVLCGVELRCVVDIMDDEIKCVFPKYQQLLMEVCCVPRTSFGRAPFGKDGVVNKLFLSRLFIYMDVGIQF